MKTCQVDHARFAKWAATAMTHGDKVACIGCDEMLAVDRPPKTEVEELLWELGTTLYQKSFDVKDEELKSFLKEMNANVREIEGMLRKEKSGF